MPAKFQPITVKPSVGGRLITRASLDEVGLMDYSIKRDFRRDLDQEIRREGHDYFWPNTTNKSGVDFSTNPQNQPFPNNVTQTSIASITRSGTTATATVTDGHMFVEGETVKISGATQSAYNGTFVISNVTRTTFQFTVSGSPATPATGTPVVKSAMPVNLIHLARRPNGKTAVIVGTATRLFRFFAVDNGDYFDGNGTSSRYLYESDSDDPGPVLGTYPYFNDNPGDWIIIGSGYSVNGQRWEAVSINGFSVFNNGVDLPVTYRVEESEVQPIYEMREQGIAAVGTITEFNGILMCADVSEIQEEKLSELFALIGDSSGGDILASQSGNTVTTNASFFSSSDVGKYIVFSRGIKLITAYTSPTQVTVGGSSETIAGSKFKLRIKASQTGSYFSGSDGGITGSLDNATMVFTASAAPSTIPVVGQHIRMTNGFSSKITVVTDSTHYTLTAADAPGANYSGLLFYVIDAESSYADYIVTAGASIFTDAMVGRTISWDNGQTRKIRAYISGTQVRVDSDLPIGSDFIGIENPETYAAYTDPEFINRIQYRVIWSALEEPRRFSSSVPGTIVSGSNILTLQYPARSFESGQEILVLGAGVNGGNLTATILSIAANRIMILNTFASTTVSSGLVQQSDATGSIVGSFDLQDDSSAIIRMLALGEALVVYKDTAIFLGIYTGVPAAPFDFRRRGIPKGSSLFYRNTLVKVGADFHVYAGKNAFYSFDMTSQRPKEIELIELCKDLFFAQASLANTNRIFAADNAVTKEIVFAFPSSTSDKAIAFDYSTQTVSTTSAEITAAETVKRPETGTSVGATEDWFVMATTDSVILLYGKVDTAVASWASAKEIIYRRHANPFSSSKVAYSSVIASGLSDFGDPHNEKDLESYTLLPASQSANSPLSLELLGVRNVSETPAVLSGFPYSMLSPKTESIVPVYFRENYFQDRITISGYDNPFRLARRIWNVSGVKSQGATRAKAAA